MKDDPWKTIHLGPLPVAAINRHLGLNLAPGNVVFFAHTQEHALERQPGRRHICFPHLGDVVADPTHVGQKEQHKGESFHLIRVVVGGPIILLGIRLKPLKSGVYTAKTTHPLKQKDLEAHLRKKISFQI